MTQPKDVLTIGEVVHFAMKAAAEAYSAVFDDSGSPRAADQAARAAYRSSLPVLESRASVQAYVAAVVRGIELHLISVRESHQLIKAARLWISAEQHRQAVPA